MARVSCRSGKPSAVRAASRAKPGASGFAAAWDATRSASRRVLGNVAGVGVPARRNWLGQVGTACGETVPGDGRAFGRVKNPHRG